MVFQILRHYYAWYSKYYANRTIKNTHLEFMRGRTLDNVFAILDKNDIIRHKLVTKIITAYGRDAKKD